MGRTVQASSFYITTPIYYVNDAPHIGHAYTSVVSDVIARFYRLDGRNVRFLSGTDEHGQKNERAAQKAGVDPQDYVDQYSQNFRTMLDQLNCAYDVYGRTSSHEHKKAAQALWSRLSDAGQIYLGSYAGWYSVRDEAFYDEGELIDGKAPTGAPVEWVEEPSYFFKLSEWQEPLLKYFRQNPNFVAPQSRYNEVIRFVESGLHDLSISRTALSWGIKVPNDPVHTLYVWLDALTIYLTGAGFPDVTSESYQAYWPASLHVMGKDILRFHAVYWPAFLLAANLPVPKRIFAHGWWTNEGQKMSKSLGNVITPAALIDHYGVDQTRYCLVREIQFGQDGNFSDQSVRQRINSDLANDLGNLFQRVLRFINKTTGGEVIAPGIYSKDDETLLQNSRAMIIEMRATMNEQALNKTFDCVWNVIGEANRYVDSQKPWALAKDDPTRMMTVLYVLLATLQRIAIVLQPLMPESAEKMLDMVGVDRACRSFDNLGQMPTIGLTLPEPTALFLRCEVER